MARGAPARPGAPPGGAARPRTERAAIEEFNSVGASGLAQLPPVPTLLD